EIFLGGSFSLAGLVGRRQVRQFLEYWVSLHFLLHEVAQLKQRRLENQQALLQLRRQNLLQGEILCLLHSLASHMPRLPAPRTASKQFRRAVAVPAIKRNGGMRCPQRGGKANAGWR